MNHDYSEFDKEQVSILEFLGGFNFYFQHPKEAKTLGVWRDGPVNVLIINLNNFAEKTDFVEFALTFAGLLLFEILTYCFV